MKKRTGGCACSAIRYEVTGEPFLLQNGHCKSCQRLTGTAFRMGSNWSEEPVRVVSGDMTTYSRKADSGRTFETKFCKVCGTTVFTFAESQPERVQIGVGTFDDTSWVTKPNNIFSNFKQKWQALPDGEVKKSEGYSSDDYIQVFLVVLALTAKHCCLFPGYAQRHELVRNGESDLEKQGSSMVSDTGWG